MIACNSEANEYIDTEHVGVGRLESGGQHEREEKRIHLQPEPTSDPKDPLNFPLWRKVVILLLMSSYAFISTGSSTVLGSALPNLVTAWATVSDTGQPTGLVAFSDLTHLIAVRD